MDILVFLLRPVQPKLNFLSDCREPGQNDCGIVVFEMSLRTPDCPDVPRKIVVICNDITYESGSFGTREDAVFYLVDSLSFPFPP